MKFVFRQVTKRHKHTWIYVPLYELISLMERNSFKIDSRQ